MVLGIMLRDRGNDTVGAIYSKASTCYCLPCFPNALFLNPHEIKITSSKKKTCQEEDKIEKQQFSVLTGDEFADIFDFMEIVCLAKYE